MVSAFLYLFICSFRNRVRVRLRRLRQPRYLIGAIVGVLYLYVMVFNRGGGRPRRGSGPGPNPLAAVAQFAGPLQFFGGLVLFLLTAMTWLMPGASKPIEFTRAEVQFLFQAPLTRRQLIHYKLLRGQVGAAAGSAVATIFLRPASFAAGWTFFVGLWVMFAIVRLHFIGIALRRQSLAEHRLSGIVRNWLPLSMVATAVVVLAGTVALDWPTLSSLTNVREVVQALYALGAHGPLSWVLWPFVAIVTLPLSGTPEAFLRALPAALLLLAVNYIWVLQADRAFEEASAADAERRAVEYSAPRTVRSTAKAAPFTLALTGPPETAIFWKNLILLGRYATPKALLRLLPIVIAVGVAAAGSARSAGLLSFVTVISLIAVAMTILVGPQAMRNDFRQDLSMMPVLKSWPIRGPALVRGELLAPAAVLTGICWLLLLLAALLMPPVVQNAIARSRAAFLSPGIFAVVIGLVVPGLIVVQLTIQNALAVLFPAWIAVGPSRPRGIDAMGQRLLMTSGIVLVLALSLVPALVAGGLVAGVLFYAAPSLVAVHAVIGSAVAGATLIAECVLAAEWLGRVFERTDVSAIEASE